MSSTNGKSHSGKSFRTGGLELNTPFNNLIKQKDFQKMLRNCCQLPGDQVLRRAINVSSENSIAGVLKCRTHFWKRTTQESLQQSLVEIGSVVSSEKIFFKFHPPFFLICPFKIVSVSAVLYPRWPPLLNIEISSNGQNCSILSQNLSKFELYKHNDGLFNMYYGIIYIWALSGLK
jgi:hypothetical protein